MKRALLLAAVLCCVGCEDSEGRARTKALRQRVDDLSAKVTRLEHQLNLAKIDAEAQRWKLVQAQAQLSNLRSQHNVLAGTVRDIVGRK